MKYDAAVIGAGPAGAYCAKILASRGLKVLLMDKEKFPRDKVCGGLISAKALELIQDDQLNKLLSKIRPNPVQKIILTCGQKEVTKKKDRVLGLVVKRKEFDEALVNIAADGGADFVDHCEYITHRDLKIVFEIYTTKGTFFSDYLIGADGAFSKVARESKLRQRFLKWEMGFAVCSEIPREMIIEKNGIEFVLAKVLGGMGWVFSGNDFVNLGVGGYATEANRIFQCTKRLLAERLIDKNSHFDLKGYFLPAGGRKRPIARDRIFLVGDAAGLVDPFSGEGVFYALKSSQIAADTIENNKQSKDYEQTCYKTLLKEFRFSALLSVFLGDRNQILKKGIEMESMEAFEKILTVPPQKGCYKSIISRIIKHGISPVSPYLWLKSLLLT